MAGVSYRHKGNIQASVDTHDGWRPLRVVTYGSAAEAASLISRLLYKSKLIVEELIVNAVDSTLDGTRSEHLEIALNGDYSSSEYEQDTTINVACRYFSTDARTFIVADNPCLEQGTNRPLTGSVAADLAVILLDARTGVSTETRRHAYLVSLIGIPRAVVAITNMDMVGHSEEVYANITREFREFSAQLGLLDVTYIPISAVGDDTVAEQSTRTSTPWYTGLELGQHLKDVALGDDRNTEPLRLLVRSVNKRSSDFPGFTGVIVGGTAQVGDAIRVLPSGRRSHLTRIIDGNQDLQSAAVGQSVTVILADEVDVGRGDVLAAADAPPGLADQFEATIVWMHEHPMLQGRSYLLAVGGQTVMATVAPLKYRVNVDTMEHVAAKKLELNDIGVCGLDLSRPIVFEPYPQNRDLGGFILIDSISRTTVGAGLLHFALRRSENVHWQALDVDRRARAELKGQKPCVIWFTGLSGAGKSTVGNLLERRLCALGRHTYLLDGDNVRHGLNRDLGFTEADRVENIRRVAEVAHLMADAGLIVLVSFISPFRAERRMARRLMDQGEFFEVFIDTPLSVAEERDPKGLYKKARRGELKNFTGVDSPYEIPENAEIRIDTTSLTPEQAAQVILEQLRNAGIITAL